MNIGIRLLKASGILRFLLFRIFVPVWHWIISGLEAIYWSIKLGKRAEDYRKIFANIKGGQPSPKELSEIYRTRRFSYKPDPARGMLDYSSRPWVSLFKNWGDCDDMARLAYEVLDHEYAVEWIFLYGSRGGHAVTITRDDEGDYWVNNNQYIDGPFAHKWDAIESGNFGEVPDLWVSYKKRKAVS